MGTNSKIEWCEHTLNFWRGCDKVDECCDHCYAERNAKMYGWDFTTVSSCSDHIWAQPQVINKQYKYRWAAGDKVFVCSISDFFHKEADQWRKRAWVIIFCRSGLEWIFTTKRIERVAECLPDDFTEGNYPHITIMPTCGTQKMADERRPVALELKAKYPWIKIAVSIEPMLGEIDLNLCSKEDLISPDQDSPVGCIECRTNKHWEFISESHNCGIDWVIVDMELNNNN